MRNKEVKLLFLAAAFLAVAAVPVATGQSRPQDEINTIFGNRCISHGGYGGLNLAYGRIDGKDALVMGARGSWVIGHSFAIGIGGSAFFNEFHYNPDLPGGPNVNLAGGYGGLVLEPILFGRWPVHLAFPVMLGAGGVAYTNSYSSPLQENFDYFVEDTSPFLIAEPGIELELNVVRHFRVSVGIYRRYTTEVVLVDTDADVLDGLSKGVTLKFGKF